MLLCLSAQATTGTGTWKIDCQRLKRQTIRKTEGCRLRVGKVGQTMRSRRGL